MNYGYDSTTTGWNKSKQSELAERLRPIVAEFRDKDSRWDGPRVVVDDPLYGGVRIRKMTNLTPEQDAELVSRCDVVYDEVMGLCQA